MSARDDAHVLIVGGGATVAYGIALLITLAGPSRAGMRG